MITKMFKELGKRFDEQSEKLTFLTNRKYKQNQIEMKNN